MDVFTSNFHIDFDTVSTIKQLKIALTNAGHDFLSAKIILKNGQIIHSDVLEIKILQSINFAYMYLH